MNKRKKIENMAKVQNTGWRICWVVSFQIYIHWMWVWVWVCVMLTNGEGRTTRTQYQRLLFYILCEWTFLFVEESKNSSAYYQHSAQQNGWERRRRNNLALDRMAPIRKNMIPNKNNKAKMNTKWKVNEHVSLFIIESICSHQAIWRYRIGTYQIRRFFESWQFMWRQIWRWRYIYLSVYVRACQKCFEWFRWDATI